ncbi:hypothetical protein BDP27DRAFT_782891 [Rhodocollybia butyracea]|uniref:DUF6534 domain-containing protein n=1 Tax=Rhodocollybia butyracea TaxID=206335 RepID=A0A9P5PSF9_9AGAR|nr:hypothetical protein BDP27DRAFT_782891 [Rhodocollybia butyracea]
MSEPAVFLTLGAAFIGFAVSCLLLGIFISQIIQYLSRYPKDKLINKVLVAMILLLELGHQGLISHALFYYNISNFARPTVLSPSETVIWSIIVQQTVGSITGFIVKMCFAVRVWRFSQDIIVSGILVVLNFTELALSIAYTFKSFQFDRLEALPNLKSLASFALGCGALTDWLLAASLCFYLHRLRIRENKHIIVHNIITTLSIYALSTGFITSAFGIATIICYHFMPANFIFIAIYFVLTKLYGISLLAALNTRRETEGGSVSTFQNNSLAQTLENVDSLTSLPLRSTRRNLHSRNHITSSSSRASSIRAPLRHADINFSSRIHLDEHDFGLPIPELETDN